MASSRLDPQYVVNSRGQKKAVVLSLPEYNRLLERMSDLEDALELDDALRTAKSFRNYDDIRAELRKSKRL